MSPPGWPPRRPAVRSRLLRRVAGSVVTAVPGRGLASAVYQERDLVDSRPCSGGLRSGSLAGASCGLKVFKLLTLCTPCGLPACSMPSALPRRARRQTTTLKRSSSGRLERIGVKMPDARRDLANDAKAANLEVTDLQLYGLFEDVLTGVRKLTRDVGSEASVSLHALREAGQTVVRLQGFINRHLVGVEQRARAIDSVFEKSDRDRATRLHDELAALVVHYAELHKEVDAIDARLAEALRTLVTGGQQAADAKFTHLRTTIEALRTTLTDVQTSLHDTLTEVSRDLKKASQDARDDLDKAHTHFQHAVQQVASRLL